MDRRPSSLPHPGWLLVLSASVILGPSRVWRRAHAAPAPLLPAGPAPCLPATVPLIPLPALPVLLIPPSPGTY
ncbi:hypothetical protein B0H17DRAFT_1338787 [Mycena rosella]|uniref:Uncharacterized protein n=1 Tax=Mycena rosella TaxID=1033263 RepID=A0AAD7FXQ7_MYCRO|nr:hypothetical protein B0H17DRAFT_1338787 [Mycena rosella]